VIFKQQMVEKILVGEKTVTRRPVRKERIQPFGRFGEFATVGRICRYQVGRDYAVQPAIEDGSGKGRGGKEVARIRVLEVDRFALEPCGYTLSLLVEEGRREGFKDWFAFRDYWRALYGNFDPTQLVDRIEFELIPESVQPTQEAAGAAPEGASHR
jgi:hypothetical protein